MPIFYRYLTRETLGIFAATCLILLAIIISFRLNNLLASAANGDISLSAVWQLIGLQSLRFLIVLMPISLILAFGMSMGRLYSEQELPAALACGISPKHITRAVLSLSIPMAILVALGNVFVLPLIYQHQDSLRIRAEQEAAMVLFRANEFRRLDDGTVVYTAGAQNNHLAQFFVYRDEEGEQSAIFAPQGRFGSDPEGRYLELDRGLRVSWHDTLKPENSQLSQFAHARLRLPNNRVTSSSRLRNMALSELPNDAEGIAEWQNRINPAVALIVFSTFLPILTRTRPRSSRYQKLIPIFVLFAAYLNSLNVITTAISNQKLPPWPGSFWLHLIVFGFLLMTAWYTQQTRRKT